MHLAKTLIRARFRSAPASKKATKFIGYGMAALVPAMGLIGAARADAPAPAAGFAPIEVSADIDAELTSPVAAAVDTHIDLDTDDLLDDAQDVLEDLGNGGASYYGPNLAGNRTASGERFDPTQLTAAHRTLPMGSKVKVTHNGKSVIVRINDRGPFHGNRVIDLSTAAAKKIGLFRAGTGTVGLQLVNG
ncbi:septal ring lytic transglycosylase RlpA family protein [Novosphingopyxis baekryungensis]|jgi:rare lipoprotein A|uniref:septal ring lytic transglycosylase RlpA family protein n=1 Tax=Novosphingopyxis baekryungensis TaxID=279369 RepID=UPI0003B31130|nr:septal ring lytic transglycosylase RlpA family protein [Novosphingopyxis baekryungensis]